MSTDVGKDGCLNQAFTYAKDVDIQSNVPSGSSKDEIVIRRLEKDSTICPINSEHIKEDENNIDGDKALDTELKTDLHENPVVYMKHNNSVLKETTTVGVPKADITGKDPRLQIITNSGLPTDDDFNNSQRSDKNSSEEEFADVVLDKRMERVLTAPEGDRKSPEKELEDAVLDERVERVLTAHEGDRKSAGEESADAVLDERVERVLTAPEGDRKSPEEESADAVLDERVERVLTAPEGDRNSPGEESADAVLDERTERVLTVPEGGWGWFVVFSSLLIHVITGGIDKTSGILYLKFQERFQTPAAVTAWVPALSQGLRLALAPLVSALCNRYSHRSVVIWGGIVLGISAICSGFAPSIYVLFLTYGIIGGIGNSMSYCPAIVMIGIYFHKKISTATGLAVSGVGLGAFVFPVLLETCFSYYGYTGLCVILSGVLLQVVVCGALMRPMSVHRKITKLAERKVDIRASKTVTSKRHQLPSKKHTTNIDGANEIDIVIDVNRKTDTQRTRHRRSSVVYVLRRRISSGFILSNKGNKNNENQTSKLFDLSLFKNARFCAVCSAIFFYTIAVSCAYVFFPALAKQIGATNFESAYAVTISGIADGVSRVTSGFVLDRKLLKPYRLYLYNVIMVTIGLAFLCIPLATNILQLTILFAVFGFLLGICVSQKSVVLVDLLGPDKLSHSIGIVLLFQGIATFIGPPLSGLLKDINGTYDSAYYFAGSGVIFGSVVLFATNVVHYLKTRSV